MSFIQPPYRYHPRQKPEPGFIVDIIIVIALLITAAICLCPAAKPQFHQTPTQGDTTP